MGLQTCRHSVIMGDVVMDRETMNQIKDDSENAAYHELGESNNPYDKEAEWEEYEFWLLNYRATRECFG